MAAPVPSSSTQGAGPFCTSCGKPVPEDARFCRSCGATQGVSPVPAPAPNVPQDKTEITRTFTGVKAVRKIGMRTIEAEWSLGRVKVRVDGQELLSKYKFILTPEIISVGDKKFIVKLVNKFLGLPLLTIEELTSESQKFSDPLGKLVGFLRESSKAFEATSGDSLAESTKYYARYTIIPAALYSILATFYSNLAKTATEGHNPAFSFSLFITFWFLFMIGAFVGGTILHVFVYVAGGRKGVSQTMKAVMYGSTPGLLFGWVPIAGILAWIWALVLQGRGLRQFHGITTSRATAGILAFIFVNFLGATALGYWYINEQQQLTGPAFKGKATQALLSVRSYDYTTRSTITVSPLPISGPDSGSAVTPLRTVSLRWGTIDTDAGRMVESVRETNLDGVNTTTSTAAVGDFIHKMNSCTGWSKRGATPAERKQFIGEQDQMNNFTAQLFNISTLKWNGTTRLGDRDVHVVRVMPDKKKMRSLIAASSNAEQFFESLASFDATYWLESGTLYPVNSQITMTFNIPPNGAEPGYMVEMLMRADYSEHNRVAPVVLPKGAEAAREISAGSEDLLEDSPYTVQTAGLGICKPSGWTQADPQTIGIPSALLFFFDPKKDSDGAKTFSANINVVPASLPGGDFDALVKLLKDQITQQTPGAQLVTGKTVALDSGQGYLFEYTAPQAGFKLRFLQLLAPNPKDKNTVFVVTFTALDSNWTRHKNAAMASLLSFQSKASPTPGTPSPPPISPSIALVRLPPQKLLLTADQFPLPGYNLSKDEALGESGRYRLFEPIDKSSSEFWWISTSSSLFDALPLKTISPSEACKWNGKVESSSVVDAPVVGDYSIACKFTFADSTPVFRYYVYTHNVLITLGANLKDIKLTDDQVLGFLAALAQYQIVVIDHSTASLTFQPLTPFAKPGVCADKACFIASADSCKTESVTIDESYGVVRYDSRNCVFTKTVVSLNPSESREMKTLLQGKSMTCSYEKGKFDHNWVDSLLLGIERCEGELKEAISDLLVFA